jgi:hypothetical protein
VKDVLVLRRENEQARAEAKRLGAKVEVRSGWELTGDRTLFIEPGANVAWPMVAAGMHFLRRWDVAVPLWRYGTLAKDVGTPEERKRTEAVVGDLRVLLYSHELLFVRDSEGGRAFVAALAEEATSGGEVRLAFLRAMHRVKPILCTLPRTWLLDVQEQAVQAARKRKVTSAPVKDGNLVLVEVRRNVYVKCRPGEEATVLEDYKLRHMRREERKKVGK